MKINNTTKSHNIEAVKMRNFLGFATVLISLVINVQCDNFDVLIDAKATQQHRVDSLNLLIYCEFPTEFLDFSTFRCEV